MKIDLSIKHPEWLTESKPQESIRSYLSGSLPKPIAGWCIVVGCKHPLRAVYGSDLRAALHLLLDALWDKWEARIQDPALRLWYRLPWAYAWLVTYVSDWTREYPGWGRRESPEPVLCPCGWRGMRRWAIHAYRDDGSGEDVEPSDECPRCGDEV